MGTKDESPEIPGKTKRRHSFAGSVNHQFFKNPIARLTHSHLLMAVPACKSRDAFTSIVATDINTTKHPVCRALLMRKWN